MSNVPAPLNTTSTKEIAIATGAGSKIAPQNLDQVVRFAEVMARAGIALPQHLRDNAGACMAVALQALEWEMSPFAVASKSYSVNGVIAYEAQLIAAVVNSRSGLTGRLKYSFDGSGDDLRCTVVGIIDGEAYEYSSPRKGDIRPQNSPLWKTDPEQQLGYYSARAWARRYTPEVLLGVYDREEAASFQGANNARDVTPKAPTLTERMAAKRAELEAPAEKAEGFDLAHVDAHTSAPAEAAQEEARQIWEEGQTIDGTPAEGDLFPGDTIDAEPARVELEQQQEDSHAEAPADPLAEYAEALKACSTPDEVEALTPQFADAINALSKEDKRRAKEMRLARAKETEGMQE